MIILATLFFAIANISSCIWGIFFTTLRASTYKNCESAEGNAKKNETYFKLLPLRVKQTATKGTFITILYRTAHEKINLFKKNDDGK